MIEAKKGTTTVGMIVKDAVILGADMKSTIGYMVDSKVARKIYQLDNHVAMTIAGSVGDALALVRILKAQFKLYRIERGPITIKAAANLLSNILQGTKYYPYMNQLILAGFDKTAVIYSFDPLGGYDTHDNVYSTGSGSPFAYGVLESEYKDGMSVDEGVKLALRALKAARSRDIATGGAGFTVAIIDKNGYNELSEKDIKKYI